MNFMNTLETGEVPVELKYCERCGGLWLRPPGADVVYCRGCQEHLAAWPRTSERPALAPRRPQAEDLHGQSVIEFLPGMAAIEVQP
jgi:hypothetical protein